MQYGTQESDRPMWDRSSLGESKGNKNALPVGYFGKQGRIYVIEEKFEHHITITSTGKKEKREGERRDGLEEFRSSHFDSCLEQRDVCR